VVLSIQQDLVRHQFQQHLEDLLLLEDPSNRIQEDLYFLYFLSTLLRLYLQPYLQDLYYLSILYTLSIL
jgi:hypothetical protein